MDFIEQAGQEVLQSYGQVLDQLSANCYSLKQKLKHGAYKSYEDSIGVQIEYPDHSYIHEKVDADNNVQYKILTAFAAINKEVCELEKELMKKYAPLISRYEEACPDKSDRQRALAAICKFLPTLFDILNFVHRCRQTLTHLLRQLVCYYDFQRKSTPTTPNDFSIVFSTLGCLLKQLVTLDTLFGSGANPVKEHLSLLLKTTNSTDLDLSDFEDMKPLISVISQVINSILSHNIFSTSLQTNVENRHTLGNCAEFKKHLNSYFKSQLSVIETKENDVYSLAIYSNVVIAYIFGVNVFGISDKKVDKVIRDMSKKYTIATLCDGIMWVPSHFLHKHLELKLRENVQNFVVNQQSLMRCLEQVEANLQNDIKQYTFKVYKWSLKMCNVLSIDSMYIKLNDLDSAHLCFEGLTLCKQMKLLINSITYLHSTLSKPMTKAVAVNLCKITEVIKAVKSIFQRHQLDIGKRINHIIQRFLIQCLTIVSKAKKGIINSDGCQDVQINDYSALELTEKLLYGACTEDNMLVVQLALTFLSSDSSLTGEGTSLLGKLLSNLRTISLLNDELEKLTDCNVLFKEPHILPIYFKHVMDSELSLFRYQLILHSLPSCPEYLTKKEGILQFSKETFEAMVVPVLCQRIETFLRLHAHSHLQEGENMPLDQNDFRDHLRVPTLTVARHYINTHSLAEDYLDNIFYDLATVALHDWQTYREMRSLAEHELKLFTVEDYLPSQTLSQGLDILDIMRNIHVFVSRYLYNLNNQCFIESNSNNKHLNTIKINQLANSIWTHGTGVMNTTTNFVYQYLKKKIVQFSQFMYDETISSRLMKDKAHFLSLKSQQQVSFPFDRALKFSKSLSRLGTTDGINYLDQCRLLITQIGNSLGYIRMVKTGGLHHCLEASSYVPQVLYVYSSKENLRPSGCDSIDCLVQTACSLINNLANGSEYLKILTDVFSSIFDTPENSHLKLFPIILPSLTFNYINYIVTEKEKVSKRSKNGMIFTDDGFAIGVTYLLSVLSLHGEFESLHWFDSVNQMYADEEKSIQAQLASQPADRRNGDNTLKLSIRRLKLYKKEFDLLYYNMNSAKVFFF